MYEFTIWSVYEFTLGLLEKKSLIFRVILSGYGCVDGGNRKKVDDEILSPAQLRRIGEYVDINRNGLLSAQFQ